MYLYDFGRRCATTSAIDVLRHHHTLLGVMTRCRFLILENGRIDFLESFRAYIGLEGGLRVLCRHLTTITRRLSPFYRRLLRLRTAGMGVRVPVVLFQFVDFDGRAVGKEHSL